jgi:hypothetical protein
MPSLAACEACSSVLVHKVTAQPAAASRPASSMPSAPPPNTAIFVIGSLPFPLFPYHTKSRP